eukprot:TRINITY_DN47541_c0_g1_i1.p1 TRINITY_DN47541_c0_g1~~TRINITY_DN47541_c0_g1_i1.p1  ORF type:complete len:579 (-),score=91.65 TRINITY_DN47541_c0_g1_i1:211-1947(-)
MDAFKVYALLTAWLTLRVTGQTTNVAVTLEGQVMGSTPNSILVVFRVSGVGALVSGDKIVVTAKDSGNTAVNNFFGSDGAATVPVFTDGGAVATPAPTITTATISGTGSVYTITMTGAVSTGSDCTFTIPAGALGFLPATGTNYELEISTLTAANGVKDSAQTTGGTFNVIAAPTITWSGGQNAGDQPISLRIQVSNPFQIAVNDVIELHSSQNIFIASVAATTVAASPGNVVTMAQVDSSSTYETDATQKLFKVTVLTAATTIGSAIDILITGSTMLTTLPSNAGAVTLTIKMGTPGSLKTVVYGRTGWLTISVGSDPVARFGNTVRVFELPPGVLTPLIRMPDLNIAGSVFEGGGSYEQWFDRFVITTADDSRFMDIKMKRLPEGFNASTMRREALQTMDVTLGYGTIDEPQFKTHLQDIGTSIPLSFLGYMGLTRRVSRHHTMRFTSIGRYPRECIDLAGAWAHFYVCTSPADEYYGNLRNLALKYAHLDIGMVEVKDYTQFHGTLPELWGLVPMSEATKALVKEDKSTWKKLSVSSDLGLEKPQKECTSENSTQENATQGIGLSAGGVEGRMVM